MITPSANSKLIARLSTLKYFPTKQESIEVVMEAVMEFASTDDQADWLGKRMLKLFTEWPGPRELRAVFCARFKPADGIEADSATFTEGVPSEHPQLPPPPLLALPVGHTVTCDAELDEAVQNLAQACTMPRRLREDPPCVPEGPPTERCHKCGGPGLLATGAFCDCAMGRDLEGVARRRPELFAGLTGNSR